MGRLEYVFPHSRHLRPRTRSFIAESSSAAECVPFASGPIRSAQSQRRQVSWERCGEEEAWGTHSSYLSRPNRGGVSTCVAVSDRLLWLQRAQSLSHSR